VIGRLKVIEVVDTALRLCRPAMAAIRFDR
jgi:hypothetical protein